MHQNRRIYHQKFQNTNLSSTTNDTSIQFANESKQLHRTYINKLNTITILNKYHKYVLLKKNTSTIPSTSGMPNPQILHSSGKTI